MQTAPRITDLHKKNRLTWCFDQIIFTPEEWRTVVFSEEKKFSLDEPDGNAYFWYDMRTDDKNFSTRKHGGGSVMVWACFSYYGRSAIDFMNGKQESECCLDLMESSMLPMDHTRHDENWVYMQENAPINTSRKSLKWFRQSGVALMPWPENLPDLNPIENLWGVLSRRGYDNNQCYKSISEEKVSIQEQWHEIYLKCLQKLVGGMHNRFSGTIKSFGALLSY